MKIIVSVFCALVVLVWGGAVAVAAGAAIAAGEAVLPIVAATAIYPAILAAIAAIGEKR